MTGASPELVERLYRRLVEAVREREDGGGPLTIADLYQHLIPYRGVRSELGVLELAQYEHALLRLLSGEGGFVRLGDEDARRELTAELKATNPILGIYRDYATVGVDLLRSPAGDDAPRAADRAAAGDRRGGAGVLDVAELGVDESGEVEAWDPLPPPLPELRYPPPRPAPPDATRVAPPAGDRPPSRPVAPQAPPSQPAQHPAPSAERPRANPSAPAAPAVARSAQASPPAPGAVPASRPAPPRPPTDAPGSPRASAPAPPTSPTRPPPDRPAAAASPANGCAACGMTLPDVEGVRFCPRCGTHQPKAPCGRCGTELRPSWNFCIRCGTRRRVPPAP